VLINLINLDKSTDRLAEFIAVNGHLQQVGRWSAVDGSRLDIPALIRDRTIDKEIMRVYSKGSLGAALSHVGLWDHAIASDAPLTICEDDAIFHRRFEPHAEAIMKALPGDCDIILWGWNFDAVMMFSMLPGVSPCLARFDQTAMQAAIERFQSLTLAPQPFRLLTAFGIMCYTIFPKGARALKEFYLPIREMKIFVPGLNREIPNYGVDVAMAGAYPRLNAFVCFPPIVISKNEHAKSLSFSNPASSGIRGAAADGG
jgi:glycosyl transferase, family 25